MDNKEFYLDDWEMFHSVGEVYSIKRLNRNKELKNRKSTLFVNDDGSGNRLTGHLLKRGVFYTGCGWMCWRLKIC